MFYGKKRAFWGHLRVDSKPVSNSIIAVLSENNGIHEIFFLPCQANTIWKYNAASGQFQHVRLNSTVLTVAIHSSSTET
jgi:hypothetical protein